MIVPSLINPWVILGIAAAMAVTAVTSWHVSATYTAAAWHEREAEINAESAKKIGESKDRVIAAERRSATEMSMVSAEYQRQLKESDDAKNRAIADHRAGVRRLSVPARCPSSGDGLRPPDAGIRGRDGEARAELSDAAAQFLVALASEADAVTRQLTACQAVVTKDRAAR